MKFESYFSLPVASVNSSKEILFLTDNFLILS